MAKYAFSDFSHLRNGGTQIDIGEGVSMWSSSDNALLMTIYPDGYTAEFRRNNLNGFVIREFMEKAHHRQDFGPDPAWQIAVEHDLLHTLISRCLHGKESGVLRHVAGALHCYEHLRNTEEELVIQYHVHCYSSNRDFPYYRSNPWTELPPNLLKDLPVHRLSRKLPKSLDTTSVVMPYRPIEADWSKSATNVEIDA